MNRNNYGLFVGFGACFGSLEALDFFFFDDFERFLGDFRLSSLGLGAVK